MLVRLKGSVHPNANNKKVHVEVCVDNLLICLCDFCLHYKNYINQQCRIWCANHSERLIVFKKLTQVQLPYIYHDLDD